MIHLFPYRQLCFYRLNQVKWCFIDLMEVHGCEVLLGAEHTALEIYQRIAEAYPRGIKYERNFDELKKLYKHLNELRNEIKRLNQK